MSNEISTSNKKDLNIREVAKLAQKDVDISPVLSMHTVDNMKAFLLAYSRSQLTRVIKLTDALGKLEESLIEQSLKPENADPETLMAAIRTIQNSLNSAIGLIKQVTSDESYINVIINQTNTINNTLNQYQSSAPVLSSQDSRDKVRNLVSQIIAKTVEMENDDKLLVDAKPSELVEIIEDEE